MFPIGLTLKSKQPGFAVANTAEELAALQAAGYVPDVPINAAPADEGDKASPPGGPAVGTGAAPSTVEEARAMLDAKGIPYDGRWGLARLTEALNG